MHLFVLTICIRVNECFYTMYVCIGYSLLVSFSIFKVVSHSVIRGPGDGIGRRAFSVRSGKILSSFFPGQSIELIFGFPSHSKLTWYELVKV